LSKSLHGCDTQAPSLAPGAFLGNQAMYGVV